MNLLDLTLPSPAENLACDEALLDKAEDGDSDEVLRFWESPDHFVVVGYANQIAREVNVTACAARGIPILRRCSGGGTVLQGPGCLNYVLILRIPEDGPLHTISGANRFIMERNRAALERAFNRRVEVRGHTDLAISDLKFSGNAQRRKKHFLLFHGTFLLTFDLALVNELLPMPTKQPDYRRDRGHEGFLTVLDASTESVKSALAREWNATGAPGEIPRHQIESLVREKYSTREWNFKF